MVTTLREPYLDADTLASLTSLTREWFTSSFASLSPPQRYSILNIKKRRNTLISSPTGSGKTLSCFLAVLDDLVHHSLANSLEDRVYCVYISPLKALGNDVQKNLREPLQALEELHGSSLGIRVGDRTGDTSSYQKQKMLKQPPHILVTTPESFAIMLATKKFSSLLGGVEWVVVDEVHALADNKRGVQLSLSLERLQARTSFVRIGLSATVAPLDEVAQFLVGFAGEQPRDCDVVDVDYAKKLDLRVHSPVDNLLTSTHADMLEAQYAYLHEQVQAHTTTLVFTNTRAATERVVHALRSRYPKFYSGQLASIDDTSDERGDVRTSIQAHHGSLSKDRRLAVEDALRAGELRCVVSSTSLELGIDIGFVDLVVLLGSPKSVARALQRVGRSGHQLHAQAKGRILVTDRDDLVECMVLAQQALLGRVDRVSIPRGCLDVLAQELYALAIERQVHVREAYWLVRGSFAFSDLSYEDFLSVIKYLAGGYASLEERHVYAKIWFDEDSGMFGRRGRLARVLYMTNAGTIPDQTSVVVKVGSDAVGSISEPFLEGLKKGDVFVLGGETYQFRYSRGMVAQVGSVVGKRPTVPSWYSEMLPLSFDLALQVQLFRKSMSEWFSRGASERDVVDWLVNKYPLDRVAARGVFAYCKQQFLFTSIPHRNKLLVEHYTQGRQKYVIFHTLFGRRVNDVLSRAVAFLAGRKGNKDTEIGLSDNGFYLRYRGSLPAVQALRHLSVDNVDSVMRQALRRTEVLQRRFRHCAGRSLMVLRRYKGREKSVGRQQVSSRILISAVRRLGEDFPILRAARREVLEDVMDLSAAKQVLAWLASGELAVEESSKGLPSPFAFKLVLQGYADIMRSQERQAFLRELHRQVMAKVALRADKQSVEEVSSEGDFSYEPVFEEVDKRVEEEKVDEELLLKQSLFAAAKEEDIPAQFVYEIQRLIEGERRVSKQFVSWLEELLGGSVPAAFSDELVELLRDLLPELRWR